MLMLKPGNFFQLIFGKFGLCLEWSLGMSDNIDDNDDAGDDNSAYI